MADVFMATADVVFTIADIVLEVVTEVHSVISVFADAIMDIMHTMARVGITE